jgi:hypothetical protein
MCLNNRINLVLVAAGFCVASSASVHAQYFQMHVDCPYPGALPIYSHHHLHGGCIQIAIEPVVPFQVLAAPAIGVMIPRIAPRPQGPFAPAVPGQVENFARRAVPVIDDVVPGVEIGGRVQDAGPFDQLAEIRRRVAVLKRSTPAGRQRADRMISAGDAAFAKQIYARAVALYRDAIARAPDYAEAHFRLAHAYVATRRYNLALKSAMTALELAGSSRRDGFSLAEMYRGNKFAREQHDENLGNAALREPQDGGLQFLIGFTTFYSPNPLKARQYFREAMLFQGAHQAYVRQFLPVVPIADPVDLVVDAN